MAVLKPHLALTVADVEGAVPFYTALFGGEPVKLEPGYAKFEVSDPALNFTLNEGDRGVGLGAFNHAGIQVDSTQEVIDAGRRLADAGFPTREEMGVTCCYARQDKVWVSDPEGTPWEVFAVTADVEAEPKASPATCCA